MPAHHPLPTTRWRHCGLLAVGLAVAGCDVAATPALEGATGAVERWLGGCRKYPADQQDWCVVQELAGMPDPSVLSAAERLETCGRLLDADAADTCLEQSVRFDPRVPTSACDRIQGTRLGASCTLAAADRVLKAGGALEAAITACRPTGPLLQHCVVHIAQARADDWVAAGYGPAMEALGLLVSSTHGADAMDSLGQEVGGLAARLGAPLGDGPCEYFRDGLAYASCRTRHHEARTTHTRSAQ